jgi:hypothetical protein
MRAMKVFGVIVICGAMTTAWATFDEWPSQVVYGADSEQKQVSGDLDRRLATILPFAGLRFRGLAIDRHRRAEQRRRRSRPTGPAEPAQSTGSDQ